MEWQPIETAPKTGFLLLTNGERVASGEWEGGYISGFLFHKLNSDDYVFGGDPTHWMPLPEPPASVDTLPKGQDPEEGFGAEQG